MAEPPTTCLEPNHKGHKEHEVASQRFSRTVELRRFHNLKRYRAKVKSRGEFLPADHRP